MVVFIKLEKQLFYTIASLEESFIGMRSLASNPIWSSYSKPIHSVISASKHADTSLNVGNNFSSHQALRGVCLCSVQLQYV